MRSPSLIGAPPHTECPMEAHWAVLGLSPGAGREAVKKVRAVCPACSPRGAPSSVSPPHRQ